MKPRHLLACAGLLAAAPALAEFTAEDRSWWAIQPVAEVEPPADGHPLDAFIDRKLAAAGLERAEPAGALEFLRRATFDLHGLPPTPAQVERFTAEWERDEDAAVAALVERLLESPRYGERWGQHWLDLVRFAESDGYRGDFFRPEAWRYRDYVIRSIQEDKPYDRFVREQLAGDEIAPGDPQVLVATGFLRHGVYEWNQRNAEMQHELILNEMTNVTGEVFLALGVGCAQCHDHKFDPILQKDYYAMQSFLASTIWTKDRKLGTPEQLSEYRRKEAEWKRATAEIRGEIDALLADKHEELAEYRITSFPEEVQAMYRKPHAERSAYERQIAMLVQRQVDAEIERKTPPPEKLWKKRPETLARYRELRRELEKFEHLKPEPLPEAFTVADASREPAPAVMVSKAGREEVNPAFPALLGEPPPEIEPSAAGTGRRLALADWIASPDNPFTARVMVNRIWQHHFGTGLVATPNDFGKLGTPPSHPELLDWLATRFVAEDWRMKPLHRLIMTSASYRQTARREPGEAETLADFENTLLWRFPPRRLGAEEIRDSMLAASGELQDRDGGPSKDGDAPVRSVFVKKLRNTPEKMLHCFDAPQGFQSSATRLETTTPIQSLLLTNNPWPRSRALAFARELLGDRDEVREADLARAFRAAWGREASEEEIAEALAFVSEQAELLRAERAERADAEPRREYVDSAEGFPGIDGLGPKAAVLDRNGGAGVLELERAPFAGGSFTLEAIVRLDRLRSGGQVNTLVSQWNGDQGTPGWALGVTNEGSSYRPGSLIVQLIGTNPGGDLEYQVVPSGLKIPLDRPVYLAARVEILPGGRGKADFHYRLLDKPHAPLNHAEAPINITGGFVNPELPTRLGGRVDPGHEWLGQLAWLRAGDGALDKDALWIEGARDGEALVFDGRGGEAPAAGARWIRPARKTESSPSLLALSDFCHALLSSNEFLYLH